MDMLTLTIQFKLEALLDKLLQEIRERVGEGGRGPGYWA